MAKAVEYDGKTYTLEFEPKVYRAIFGDEKHGGIGEAEEDLNEKQQGEYNLSLLTEYDRLGGYITLGGKKIENGTFYDARKKRAVTKPAPKFAKKPLAIQKAEASGVTVEYAGDNEDEEDAAPKKTGKVAKKSKDDEEKD